MFKMREYKKQIFVSSSSVSSSFTSFSLVPHLEMIQPLPAPTEVLDKLCNRFLANGTAAIVYLTDSESYGRHTMASQYFLQLAQYIRLPVISWNADNSAFEQPVAATRMQLQLAPTIVHQSAAIMTLLQRYGWNTFSIITGEIAGHRNFEQVNFKKTVSICVSNIVLQEAE